MELGIPSCGCDRSFPGELSCQKLNAVVSSRHKVRKVDIPLQEVPADVLHRVDGGHGLRGKGKSITRAQRKWVYTVKVMSLIHI